MNEIELRHNECSGTYFRSARFFKVDAKYYFSTREGTEIGPYISIETATQGLDRYVKSVSNKIDTNPW